MALLAGPGGAAAQEPDTTRARAPRAVADSIREMRDRVRQDTIPSDTVAADTLGPPPQQLPVLEPLGPASWARGVWEWDREALLRLPDLSLLQLLERIPGVVPVRADIANQPEGSAVFGTTTGGLRYIVDGFEVDPLVTPTFDASRLPLLALERVRVERRVTGATVRLETLSPDQPRPRSIVEAGTGDYGINLFRGIFLAPGVAGGPLALGFERLASEGGPGAGESTHTTAWLKWTWVRDSTGLQVEYRQSDLERAGVGPELVGSRTDWTVRGRTVLGPLTAAAYVGASRVVDEQSGLELREGAPQGGLRLRGSWAAPVPLELRTAARFRDHPRLPFAELELGARSELLPWLGVEAELVEGLWSEGPETGRWSAGARAGPLLGLSLFGQVYRERAPFGKGVGFYYPAPEGPALVVDRDGLRAGAELRLGGLMLGAAAIRTEADTVPGFGLAFEPDGLGVPGGQVTGLEAVARLPTLWEPLSLQGWYVGIDDPGSWLYLPQHHWRAALVYHHLPLPSGNLELFVRVEHLFRGGMTVAAVPDPELPAPPALDRVGAYRATNLELTIRVLSLRAFLRWENVLHRIDQRDLLGPVPEGGRIPAWVLPGQHILYGVKWEFLN